MGSLPLANGIDQDWSYDLGPPDIALMLNGQPVVAWQDSIGQAVDVRAWVHQAELPIINVVESSGNPNDNWLDFGDVPVDTASAPCPSL